MRNSTPCSRLLRLCVLAEYEIITLERLKEVQAQAEAAKVKVAEADALDAAVQLMEDFQVDAWVVQISCATLPSKIAIFGRKQADLV